VARAAALLALLILGVSLPAAAQAVVDEAVSEEATEGNSQPKFGRDASGTIHLTYVKPAGGFDQIFVASSSDGGRAWRSTQLTRRAVHSRYPSLAIEADGTLHAAWTTYEPIGHVYYARFSRERWSVPVKVSPGNAYAGVPAIAVASNRDVHLVWYGIRDRAPEVRTRHGSIYEIMYTGLARGRWSSPIVISPGIPDSINPALAVGSSGTLHSAWYQFDLRAYQVRYARRRGQWEMPQQLTTGRADAFAVTLAIGPRDRVYVVWERRGEDQIQVLFAEGPDRWSAPAVISTTTPASNPTLAVDARGQVFVAWESEGRLQLRRRTGRWLGVERITEEGRNRYPILAARGDAIDLIWTQEIGGRHRLRFAPVAGAARRTGHGGGGVGFIILALIAALLLWQLRRRQRLAPR
jgi:hypothetical protein